MRIFLIALSTVAKIYSHDDDHPRLQYPKARRTTCARDDQRILPNKDRVRLRKVLVLYVGGTIGMKKNNDGVYVTCHNQFLEKLKYHSQMHDPECAQKYFGDIKYNQLVLPPLDEYVVLYEIKEYDPLLDSSNMSVKDWIKIAKDIEANHGHFNGFVILHGTDTLVYTASALSFVLENLRKPVILTGSQIPIFETRSDAKDNILASLILAGCFCIPEVCIFFANKLMRGNRTNKTSSVHLDAFDSPNYHLLAQAAIDIDVHQHYVRHPIELGTCIVRSKMEENVATLKIFPTITPAMVKAVLQPPLRGLVIESFGAGNIPSNRPELVEVFKEAVKREVLIVNITQCPQGTVSALYETGKALEDIGVIAGNDMTSECALTKLCYILGLPDLTYAEQVELLKNNLRGELTNGNYCT